MKDTKFTYWQRVRVLGFYSTSETYVTNVRFVRKNWWNIFEEPSIPIYRIFVSKGSDRMFECREDELEAI